MMIAILLTGCPATTKNNKTVSKPAVVAVKPVQKPVVKAVPKPVVTAPVAKAPVQTAPVITKQMPLTLSRIEGNTKPPIKIAVLVPLSGQYRQLGQDLLNSAYLAMFDLNNEQIVLLPSDTRGSAAGAAAAATSALQAGAEIIIGPVFSKSVVAVKQIAARRNVNVIAFSTDRNVAGNGVYLLGLTPAQQVDRVADFASRSGLQRFAVLAPDSAYGNAVVQNIRSASLRHGIEITDISRYPANIDPSSEELHEIVKHIARYDDRKWALKQEIKRLEKLDDDESKKRVLWLEKRDTLGDVPFEAIFLPEGGDRLKAIAPLLSYYDVDPEEVKFIGTGLWADRSLGSEPALVGGWFAAPSPQNTAHFQSRFSRVYGNTPIRIASLAYDAAALAGILASEKSGPDFSRKNIESPLGFSGYDGIFRFPSTGIAQRGLAILEVDRNDLKIIDEAPESFDLLIN